MSENTNQDTSITEAKKERKPQTRKAAFKLESWFLEELLERADEERLRLVEQFNQQSDPAPVHEDSTTKERFSQKTLPSPEHFNDIVETSFWASLRKEEGSFASFAVAYEEKAVDPWTIVFEEPKPFDVENLAKLSPAMGNLKAAAKVYPSVSGALEIWGAANYYDSPLKVKVLEPGRIIVSYFIKNIAVISGEESFFIKDSLHDRSDVIWSGLGLGDSDRYFSPYVDLRVMTLLNTLRTMRSLERGGSLIILPEDEKWRNSVTSIKYAASPLQYAMHGLIKQHNESRSPDDYTNEAFELRTRIFFELERLTDSLAQLTAVDGATLVSRQMDVVGFGAKIKYDPKADAPQIVYKIDPLEYEGAIREVKLSAYGGMRHQSAAHFVSENRDAIALVVSQDGNVTAFVWSDKVGTAGAVLAFARLELTLF
jgi:hypothetical protein